MRPLHCFALTEKVLLQIRQQLELSFKVSPFFQASIAAHVAVMKSYIQTTEPTDDKCHPHFTSCTTSNEQSTYSNKVSIARQQRSPSDAFTYNVHHTFVYHLHSQTSCRLLFNMLHLQLHGMHGSYLPLRMLPEQEVPGFAALSQQPGLLRLVGAILQAPHKSVSTPWSTIDSDSIFKRPSSHVTFVPNTSVQPGQRKIHVIGPAGASHHFTKLSNVQDSAVTREDRLT